MSNVELVVENVPIVMKDVFEERHDIKFIEADQTKLEQFITYCGRMTLQSSKVNTLSEPLNDPVISELILRVPEVFLSHNLNLNQKKSINETETEEAAAASVTMQESLLTVPIKESFEKMKNLESMFLEHGLRSSFSAIPFHKACGDWAGKERQFWVREEFAHRLALMGGLIETLGLQIHFEDAFRPIGVQEGLFKRRVAWTINDHEDWAMTQVITEARSKTAVTPRLASHKGGAAVDLMLRENDGVFIDIGHQYPDGGALVYQNTPFVTQEQWQNRQILKIASKLAGLSMYVGEDWHLSFGDNLASLNENLIPQAGYIAKYGPIKEFSKITGEISDIYSLEELDTVFEI